MDTSKLKPFDLLAARAGKRVVHADNGKPVDNFTMVGTRLAFTFVGGSEVYSVLPDGSGWDGEQILFMAPEERTVWVSLSARTGGGLPCVSFAYATKEEAQRSGESLPLYICTIPITYTE